MPPKQQAKQGSSSKVAVDKTFGMKNKKGGKGQKMVATIKQAAAVGGKSPAQVAKEKERELREKEKAEIEKRAKADAALLAQPIQRIPPGVDPKTVYCVYHKAGFCQKGNKCKFSHDPDVGRKVAKRDIYADEKEEKAKDTMDKWDEEKLRTVVSTKGNPKTTTDIVCKYFIEAIETERFGWFWTCPNDEKEKNGCMYRHALPPGFVLKSQRKALEAAARGEQISIEEFIEVERHKLPKVLTPVTPETFAVWKKTRLDKKMAEQEALKAAKDAKHAAGKNVGLSGKDLFSYNPEWFQEEDADDDDGADDFDWATYRKEQQQREDDGIAEYNSGFEDGEDGSDDGTEQGGQHEGSTVGSDNGSRGGAEDS